MKEISTIKIEPGSRHDVGDLIDLPETVGRADAYHNPAPARGTKFEITVVGSGEVQEYVLLNADADGSITIEEGAQVLATDVQKNTLWYALPRTAWGER
jgi:hypothetical protein